MTVISLLFVEEEKILSLECNKATEVVPEKKDEIKIDIATERNEVEIHDEDDQEISELTGNAVEVVKNVESDKEDVEMMETNCEEHNSGLAEENVSTLSDETSGKSNVDVEDEKDPENEPLSGDDECEVTSPDVIPSSQTPSYESPFQSLRRVTIPLSSILPSSCLDSLKNKGNGMKKEVETLQPETASEGEEEVHGECGVMERSEADECESPVKRDEPAGHSVSKTAVSPVAGRTRRKLQQKTEADKTPSQTEAEDEPTEQEVSKLTRNNNNVDKADTKTSPEKPADPTVAGVSRDATSSPVPSVTNKFLRPFAAGGSPCRVTLRGRNSPGVSPTTGILKRWPGNKQPVDSPSPPGKVNCIFSIYLVFSPVVFSYKCLPFFNLLHLFPFSWLNCWLGFFRRYTN